MTPSDQLPVTGASELLAAILPLVVLICLIFFFKRSLVTASAAAFTTAAAAGLFFWRMSPAYFWLSLGKGLFLAVDIALIVFGALTFFELLVRTGAVAGVTRRLTRLTADSRIHAILLAWFLGGFIEGIAGFGTPAVIVAPLLTALGFPATTAILITLSANSTAVTFGAVGIPVRVGLAGLYSADTVTSAALVNLFCGLLIPPVILRLSVRNEPRTRGELFQDGFPFAVWSALAFTVPYYGLSHLGYEFPSFAGSLLGLALVMLSLRRGFLMSRRSFELGGGSAEPASIPPAWETFLPYATATLLLVAGKLWSDALSVEIPIYGGAGHRLSAFNPGLVLLLAGFLTVLFLRGKLSSLSSSARSALGSLPKPFFTVLFVGSLVQILLQSHHNARGAPGMLEAVAMSLRTEWLPLLSPFLGALGSFVAGSATVSNLLFGSLQAGLAERMGFEPANILALQLVGAAAGNMIALPNCVAVQASVRDRGEGWRLLATLAPYCLAYVLLAGLLGTLLARR